MVYFSPVPITLCLQPSPQRWLASLASCHGLYCLLPDTPDTPYTLTAQSDSGWVWLGFFGVGTFFTKTHCSCCVFMQADFEDLRWLGTLPCTTSVLLSKLQSIEWIFLYMCVDSRLLEETRQLRSCCSTLLAQAVTAKATTRVFQPVCFRPEM